MLANDDLPILNILFLQNETSSKPPTQSKNNENPKTTSSNEAFKVSSNCKSTCSIVLTTDLCQTLNEDAATHTYTFTPDQVVKCLDDSKAFVMNETICRHISIMNVIHKNLINLCRKMQVVRQVMQKYFLENLAKGRKCQVEHQVLKGNIDFTTIVELQILFCRINRELRENYLRFVV